MADDVPLREHLESLIDANQQRIDALAQSVRDQRGADHDAITTAREAQDKRLDGLNEFRAQLSDQSKTFVTRELHDSLAQEVERRVTAAQADVDRRFDDDRHAIAVLQAENSKLQGALSIARFLGAAGVIAGVIGIARGAGLL